MSKMLFQHDASFFVKRAALMLNDVTPLKCPSWSIEDCSRYYGDNNLCEINFERLRASWYFQGRTLEYIDEFALRWAAGTIFD